MSSFRNERFFTTMAIPALFTAELIPWHKMRGSMVIDTLQALNAELAAYFKESGTPLAAQIPQDHSNTVRVDRCFTTDPDFEGWVWVQGTVLVQISSSVDLDEARRVAEGFTSETFPRILVDVLDPSEPIEDSDGYVPPSVAKQIEEQIAKYGTAEERAARKAQEAAEGGSGDPAAQA